MSRVAYFDCFSGASGDMVLGAMIDAGFALDELRDALSGLPISGYELRAEQITRSGLTGTQLSVRLQDGTHPRRKLADIIAIIEGSSLPGSVQERATGIFRRLADAEAEVHGIPVDQVHFHEVGAVDAIIDVVGACLGFAALGISPAYASSLPLGRGMVQSDHGALPLPAPATLALIASVGAPTRPADTDCELVTPTGAAVLTSLAEFRQPSMSIDRVGTGFGQRELAWPNVLRLWLGSATEHGLAADEITVIETNLDDLPEHAGFAMERLLAAGALDVFFTPIQMKKNRPGMMLTVLANPAEAERLAALVLRETTSLGVRFRTSRRLIAPRSIASVATRFGPLQVKIKTIDGVDIVCPEFEECARIARERDIPIGDVYAAVLAAGPTIERG